jgi:eukaryotic-like serine/threonine-protein kinase
MKSDSTEPDASDRERRLEEVLAAFLAAEDEGQPPALEALTIQHPDLVDELRSFFAEHYRFGRLVAPLRSMASAGGVAAGTTQIDAEPTPAAPLHATGLRYGTTQSLGETIGLTTKPAEDRCATAPGSLNSTSGSWPIESGTRVRYFGDYELLKELGRGGMGVVYKARQISLNRPVALKMLQSGILATEDDVRRFQNEAEAVAMLDHSHIVPILEVGHYKEQRYFSMKLIGGPSLDRKIGEFTTSPTAAARLVRTLAEAVHHAHQRGILHRDLKPGNIILDDRDEPHVTDFGLAKRVQADSDLTESGAILGTPAYMAPEQASGKRGTVTTATDVYGLGAILYALLTGRAPFRGASPIETLEQVRARDPELPSKHNPTLPRALEIICLKCLEKDPARRYVSAQALAEDLRRYLNGESILARPVWLLTRAWMWCKRKPAIAGMVVASLIAVIGTIGAGLTEAGRRREATVRKEVEANYMLLQTAMEDYLTHASEYTLLNEQGPFKEQYPIDTRRLRRELLENALRYYKVFVTQRSNDPSVRQRLANAYFRVGQITGEIGSAKDAIDAFRTSRSIWQAQVAANPNDDQLKSCLADCSLAIGRRQAALGDLHEAMKSFMSARAMLEEVTGRNSQLATEKSRLADCYAEIGILQEKLGSGDYGLNMFEKAKAIQQQLIDHGPGDSAKRERLAEMINAQGFGYFKRNDFPAAIRCFHQVQEICESLPSGITGGPMPVKLLSMLALSHYNMATMLVSDKHLDKAFESFEKSLEYRNALVVAHPSVSSFREDLGNSYREVAIQAQRAGHIEQALITLQKALDVFEELVQSEPEQARYHAALGRTWNALGYIHDEMRHNRMAIHLFEKAVIEQRNAVARSPDNNEYKEFFCDHLENLGEQYLDLGLERNASPYYKEALEIRRKLDSDHPENLTYATDLADALAHIGNLQRHAGDSAGAIKSYAESRKVVEKYLKSAPDELTMRVRLAAAFTRDAWAQADENQTNHALGMLQLAIAVLEPLTRLPSELAGAREWLTEALQARARALRALKRNAEADKADADRAALWKGQPAQRLADLALSQTSRAAVIGYGKTLVTGKARAARDADLDLAADNLKLAINLGFTDVARLQSKPDSAILMERADIQPLLMDLALPE